MSTYQLRTPVGCELLEHRTLLCYSDPVIDWNNITLSAIEAEEDSVGPTFASRNLAMVHIAIFDAVNAIEGGYQPYIYADTAPPDASVDAAIATAASDVLLAVFPSFAPYVECAYDAALAATPDGQSEDAGIAVGHAAAAAIIANRADDNSSANPPFTPGTEPGEWRPTPPDYTLPLGVAWGDVSTFGINSLEPYFPPPPPALTSWEYTKDYYQVKLLGAANSRVRTPEQTEIARFWSYDSQSYGTPLVLYNRIAQNIAEDQGNTVIENARMFALINIAMADSAIVTWNAKYTYDFWRPVTAIREANTDGNPLTIANRCWLPLGFYDDGINHRTPPFPAYTSGHSGFGSAMFRTIAGFYGTNRISFCATSRDLPGVVRCFGRLSDAAKENGISRIYLGVHFNFGNIQGLISGRDIGAYDVANLLLPIGSDGSETRVPFPVVGPNQTRYPTWPCYQSPRAAQGGLFSNQLISDRHDGGFSLSSDQDLLDSSGNPDSTELS